MKFISKASEKDSVELVGGKGHQLQLLAGWDAPVPPFLVITTNGFDWFLKHGEFHPEIVHSLEAFFVKHPSIALRSSMIAEDNADSSFAGLFETILDVRLSDWKTCLAKIYASVKNDRVVEYVKRKQIHRELKMAVVAQEFLPVQKSGVIFSRSPVVPTSAIAIDAAFGLGEGVVSGHADVDHYQLTRTGDVILKVSKNEHEVLNHEELNEILKLTIELEKKAGFAADIEWGYLNGNLKLFQIRPVTRAFEPLEYFVDTNLSESYPGTVSPFTAEFVRKAYENVFTESAELLGAGADRLKILRPHYARLISCVDNHLYYNLEHYYAVIRALPGGEKNIENWHKMIGGRVDSSVIPFHDTRLSPLETLHALLRLLSMAFNHKKLYGNFLRDLSILQDEINKDIEALRSPDDCARLLHSLIQRRLGFGLTVINDIFIMGGLGYLVKKLKAQGIDETQVIGLLKTSEGVDSLKPLISFNELIKSLSDDFITQFTSKKLQAGLEPFSKPLSELEKSWPQEVKNVREFIELYGDRSFEELKLESLPLKNDPALFLQLISWGRSQQSIQSKPGNTNAKIRLNLIDRRIMDFTRQAIAMREATRLWRGRFYHLLRRVSLTLSEKLMVDSRFQDFQLLDVYSVTPSEWLAFSKGKITSEEVLRIVRSRASWKTARRNYPEIIEWVQSEPLPVFEQVTSEDSLKGQGVSGGIVEGEALVLEKPDDALTNFSQNFILVTKNTDPAWVYIMSRSKGLISERGSLLSHTAIIGRELNIPTIVGVKAATQKIKSGSRLRIDATKGTIEIL